MSAYPTNVGGSGNFMRSNRLSVGDGQGIQQNIGVQQFAPLPPDMRGSEIANALGESLGLFGKLAGTVTDVQLQQKRAQDAEDAKVEQFDRGAAVKAAADTYAELAPQIADKKLIAAVDDAHLGSYVNDLIAPRSSGQSAAWREEFDKQLHGRLLHAFGEQRDGIRKDAKDQAIDMAKWRSVGASGDTAAADLSKSAQSLVSTFGLSDMDAHAATTVPAMMLAAHQGDRAKFEAAMTVLPQGMFTDKVQEGQTILDAARQNNLQKDWAKNDAEFTSWYEKDPQNLPPTEQAFAMLKQANLSPADQGQWRRRIEEEQSKALGRQRQTVEDQVGNALAAGDTERAHLTIDQNRSKFGDEWGNTQTGHVQSWLNQQAAAQTQGYIKAKTEEVNANVYAASMRAYSAGSPGVSMLPKDVTITLPDGKQHKIETKDAIDAVRPQVFAAFDQQFKDNPQQAFAEKVKWSNLNGVDVPEWATAIKAGGMAATPENLSNPETSKTAIGGFSLWKNVMAYNPAMASRLADAKTEELYNIADGMLESSRTMGANGAVQANPAMALLNASRTIADPNYPANKARANEALNQRTNRGGPSLIEDYAKKLGSGNGDVIEYLRRQSLPLIIGGRSAEDALQTVVSRTKPSVVTVGGSNNQQIINTNYAEFTPTIIAQIPDYSKSLIDHWVQTDPAASEYKREDLSMKLDPASGRFVIIGPNNMPVNNSVGIKAISWDLSGFLAAGDQLYKSKILRDASPVKGGLGNDLTPPASARRF